MFEATKWALNEDSKSLSSESEVPLAKVSPILSINQQSSNDLKPNQVLPSNRSHEKNYIGILRRFDFDSKLQRMSVIARNYCDEASPYHYFVKGSPEKIKELSIAASLPFDFDQILEEYT